MKTRGPCCDTDRYLRYTHVLKLNGFQDQYVVQPNVVLDVSYQVNEPTLMATERIVRYSKYFQNICHPEPLPHACICIDNATLNNFAIY